MIWIKVSESFFPGDTGKSINGWKGVILGRRWMILEFKISFV